MISFLRKNFQAKVWKYGSYLLQMFNKFILKVKWTPKKGLLLKFDKNFLFLTNQTDKIGITLFCTTQR